MIEKTLMCAAGAVLGLTGAAWAAGGVESITPRTGPELKESAVEVKLRHWIADLPVDQKPQLVWTRAVWGNTDQAYNTWKDRKPWGAGKEWYYTWADVARFKGRLICTFTERNQPHNRGDTLLHVIVSDDDGDSWRSVAHYELALSELPAGNYGGLFYGYLSHAAADKLYMSGLVGGTGGYMMSATSADGTGWSALKAFKQDGKIALRIGEVFRVGWCGGSAYGVSRGGGVWRSGDGENWQAVRPAQPADGHVGGNETATAFLGDTWLVFSRSGMISAARPPYDRWDVNVTTVGGQHFHGGPNLKAFEGGIVAASRGSAPGIGGNLAEAFGYDGKFLRPMIAFASGATGTGYPGLAYGDGHLYMAFMIGGTGEHAARGRVCVAKIKWTPGPPAAALAPPVPDGPEPGACRLAGVQRIWDKAGHNGCPDLLRHGDRWLCALRESDDGIVYGCRPTRAGRIRVLASDDGGKWAPVAELAEEGVDLLTPYLSAAPDGRVMLSVAGRSFAPAEGGKARPPAGAHTRVAFSKDGAAWTAPEKVRLAGGKDEPAWLSRPTWQGGKAYAVLRPATSPKGEVGVVAVSDDGASYKVLNGPKTRKAATDRYNAAALLDFGPEETAIRFLPDGELVALCDAKELGGIAQVCRSRPPFAAWDVWNVNIRPYAEIDQPNFLIASGGACWAVARQRVRSDARRNVTVLYRLEADRLSPMLELPSGGSDRHGIDNGYPGMAFHDGLLWVTYHSGHEAKATGKKACVYLARIALPAAGGGD